MTRNRKLLLAGTALAVVGLGGAAAIARHGEHGWGHGWGHHDGRMGMGMFGPGMGGMMGGMMGGHGGRFCHDQGGEMADHMLVSVEHKVKPTDAQKAGFEDLKTAARSAISKLQAACPKDVAAAPTEAGKAPKSPSPIERLDRAQAMTEATLDALKTVRPAAEKFYASLSEEQKATLNEPRPGRHWGGGWGHRGGRGGPDGERSRGGPDSDQNRGPDGEPSAPQHD